MEPTTIFPVPTNIDAELAKAAQELLENESQQSAGQFYSLRGGQLSLAGEAAPDNQVQAVILDAVFENVYYGTKFVADAIQTPSCYAFGRNEAEMAPHPEAPSPQSESCKQCPLNEYGSSPNGAGKACRNIRRLALVEVPDLSEDAADVIAAAPINFLKIPVTSTRGFSDYIKRLAASAKVPYFAVATVIKVVPDSRHQFKVVFEAVQRLSPSLLGAAMQRRDEAQTLITMPYKVFEEVEETKPKAAGSARKFKKF